MVTSATGAVWHDIQHVISRRYPLAELILSPAIVQGDQAPESLVNALKAIPDFADPDVIIIGRGGGSLEDLWAFNDERVVRAIYGSRVPIISAVGHETDWTLADEVADQRAPTPSAAAELAVPDILQIDLALEEVRARLHVTMADMLDRALQRLDDLSDRLARVSPTAGILSVRRELDQISIGRREVESLHEILHALSPQALMERGYAFVENMVGDTPLRSIADVVQGAHIRAHLSDGCFTATVTDVTVTGDSLNHTGDQE